MKLDDFPELAKLSTPEKISLVERLWESIRTDESAVEVLESHKQELDRRVASLKSEDLLSIDELKRRINDGIEKDVEKRVENQK